MGALHSSLFCSAPSQSSLGGALLPDSAVPAVPYYCSVTRQLTKAFRNCIFLLHYCFTSALLVRCIQYAGRARQTSRNRRLQGMACFQIARAHHVQGQAFFAAAYDNYLQASHLHEAHAPTQLGWLVQLVLSLLMSFSCSLAQMYIHRGDTADVINATN